MTLEIQLRIPTWPKHIARAGPGPWGGVLGPRYNLELQTHTQSWDMVQLQDSHAHTHTQRDVSPAAAPHPAVCVLASHAHDYSSHI